MRRFHLTCACVLGMAGPACGDWPTDPATPLVLGQVQGIGSVDHRSVVTPDGATWVAWVNMQCAGALRLQRIDVDGSVLPSGGLTVASDDGCGSTSVRLAACPDGSVVCSRDETPQQPIRIFRFGPDGGAMWGDGITLTEDGFGVGGVGGFVGLAGGDVLVAWHAGSSIFVDRFDSSGARVWKQPASTSALNGPNMRLFAVLPDAAGGVYVLWSAPGKYTRLIRAARFTGEGEAAWEEPTLVVPLDPGSSRHTPPAAVMDGAGGVWIAWTRGSDGANLPLPSFVQRLFPDGSVLFSGEGLRISLDLSRQFSLVLKHDESTGDAYLAWRDGITTQTLRAQRITPAGIRAFGDSGVLISPIVPLTHFDGAWNHDRFTVVVSDSAPMSGDHTVTAYRLDESGALDAEAPAVSDPTPAGVVRVAPVDDALGVTWLRDAPSFDDLVVAQRLNADGSLGATAAADLNGDGFVNGADLASLLTNWGGCAPCPTGCAADLNGDCLVDGADLAILLTNWNG